MEKHLTKTTCKLCKTDSNNYYKVSYIFMSMHL